MKQIITLITITLVGLPLFAQVGINNTDPKASLDITATNQANPSNTDGLLIPRIDDFPATPPTAAQQGMLVYLTTTSGTNAPGYYYWDNATSSWKAMLGTSDADFFETGGTPPNNINDNIYTYGKVNIGTTDFSTSTTFRINTSENTGAYIQNNNASTPYGLTISLPANNANIKTGLNVNLSGSNSNAFISSGIKTNFTTTGNNNTFDGIQQNFNGNSTNGIINGLNNKFNASSSYRTIAGVVNNIESNGAGEHIGVSNFLGGTATGIQKGNENYIDNSGNGYHYGNYTVLSGTGNGNKYGTFNEISTAAGGTHYGVYSNVLKSGSYAGYFLGKVSIGTSTSNNYKLPSTRGSNGQIMQTDGSGNISWVTPNFNDADWYEVGTSSAPNSISDNIYTLGKVGIGINDPSAGLELIYTSDNSNNAAYNKDAMKIDYTYTRNTGIGSGLNIQAKSTGNANIAAGYFQVTNSNNSPSSLALFGFNTANSIRNVGLEASAVGSGTNNFGISSYATGGSNVNWAGYFGHSYYNDSGNVYIQDLLQVDGNLKFTNGATNNYILKTDALGNATWVNPITVFTDTDNQQVDQFSLSGTTLSISLQDDGVAPVTVDLSSLEDADWYQEGTSSAPNNINDNIFTNGFVGIGDSTPDSILDIEYTGVVDKGVSIIYNNTDNSGPTQALFVKNENLSGATSNVTGAYIQVANSIGANYTNAVYAFNTASGNKNIGLSASVSGAGQNNFGNSGTAKGASQNNFGGFFTANSTIGNNYGVRGYAFGSTINWAGYFGDLSTTPDVGSGNVYIQDLLQVDGALKFTNGATNNYILKTDASGNATWVNPTTVFTDTDNQNISGSSLSGTNLTIGIENGSSQTINLASLQDADWFEAGGTPPNNINDNIYTYGKVGIGTSSASYRLDVTDSQSSSFIARFNNTSTNTNADGIRIRLATLTPGNNNYFIGFYRGIGNTSGKIIGNGTGVLYQTTSDRRLKTNIVSIENSLDLIDKMQPRKYEYKENLGTKEYGFIAQELQTVYPQAVSGDPNGNVATDPMMVDYSRLTPILTAGIKELKQEVETLKQENQELKKQLTKYEDLEARLSALENNSVLPIND